MATLGDLVIKMSLDAASFVGDMDKASGASTKFADNLRAKLNGANAAVRQFGSQFQRALGGIGGQLSAGVERTSAAVSEMGEAFASASKAAGPVAGALGAVAAGAVAAVAGITAVAVKTADAVQAMNDLADAAQVDADTFQTFAIAARQSGIGAEQLSTAFNKLNQQMTEASEGSNQAAENFAELGVKVAQGGNVRASADVFRDVAKAIALMPQSAEKARLELELLGKSGARMDSMLRELEQRTKAASESGEVFGKQLAFMADALDRAQSAVQGQMQAIANSITRFALPAITALVEAFADWLRALNGSAAAASTAASSFEVMTKALIAVALPVTLLIDGVNGITILLGTFVDGIVAAVEAVGALGAAINAFVRRDAEGLAEALQEASAALKEFQERADARLQTPSLTARLLNIGDRARQIAAEAEAAGRQNDPRRDTETTKRLAAQQAAARAAFDKASRDAELMRRQEQQALAHRNSELERLNTMNAIALDRYYDERIAAQKEFADKTVVQYQREIAAAERLRDAKSKFGVPLLDASAQVAQDSKIADLRQRQAEVTAQAAEAEKDLNVQRFQAQRALTRDINATTAALLEQQGKLAEAAALRFDTERAAEIDRARAEGNKQREQELDTLRAITIEQGKYAESIQRTNNIANELGRTEAIIAAKVRRGQLTSFEASAAHDVAARKAIAANQREIETLSRLGTLTQEQKQRIADLAAENEVLAASIDQVGQQINEAFIGGAADALTEFIEHTKSATEAFNDFARSVVHAIDQMVAKALAEKLFQGMFGAGGAGGAPGPGGFLSSLFTSGGGGGGAAGTAAIAEQTTTTVAYASMMQHGGAFNANELLLVGEKGPELIRPSFSGQVIPGASAGGNVNLNMTINTPDAASFQRSQGQILTTMGLATQRALARR